MPNAGDEIIKLARAIDGMDNATSILIRADHAQAAIGALARLAMAQHRQIGDLISLAESQARTVQEIALRLKAVERELSSARNSDSVVM